VAVCCECGDEPSGFYTTELVTCLMYKTDTTFHLHADITLLQGASAKFSVRSYAYKETEGYTA
jgi:hypothetical protein